MKQIYTLAFLALPLALQSENMPGAHFIENWDLNGDGQITVDELEEKRDSVFASFDANEDGYIDAEEYKVFDQARANDQEANHGKGGGEGKMQKGMTLEFNDTDKDGKVSLEEFISNSPAWLEMVDKNADGAISPDDFRR